PELGGYITPANSSNFFKARTTNVVYLYDGSEGPTPGDGIIIGDADLDTFVSVMDATAIQRVSAQLQSFSANAEKAADTDDSGSIDVLDATNIQRYAAQLSDFGNVGKVIGGNVPEPGEHTFAELIDMYNQLSAKYVALPSDYYADDEGYKAAGVALDTYKSVTLNPTADPELIDEAYDAFAEAYDVIKDYEENIVIPVPDKIDVYFTNNAGWSKVNYYCWGAANMTWPGAQMTKAYTNDMGQDVYKVTIDPDVYQNIIFNNGMSGDANQTVDIVIETSSEKIGYYISNPEYTGKKSVGTWNP
ncbi:MAG: starch-binding protein, partial [Ruminococcus sp.]|nr:starch-binding protein [Ruminococcus sp.]